MKSSIYLKQESQRKKQKPNNKMWESSKNLPTFNKKK